MPSNSLFTLFRARIISQDQPAEIALRASFDAGWLKGETSGFTTGHFLGNTEFHRDFTEVHRELRRKTVFGVKLIPLFNISV